MCEYLKRMSTQNTPTDNIRSWSGLAHSVVEYTGPKPFGMDGSVCLWLHERSATQLLDMCDELDAKFSDLKTENEKLREQNHWLKKGDILHVLTDQEYFDQCERERLMQVSIDALDKENEKLREQGARLFGKTLELATENAKLRELCGKLGVDA